MISKTSVKLLCREYAIEEKGYKQQDRSGSSRGDSGFGEDGCTGNNEIWFHMYFDVRNEYIFMFVMWRKRRIVKYDPRVFRSSNEVDSSIMLLTLGTPSYVFSPNWKKKMGLSVS